MILASLVLGFARFYFTDTGYTDLAIIYINVACLLSVILLTCMFINLFIITIIKEIKSLIHEHKLREYYRLHPEAEEENRKKLAEDLKKIGEEFIKGSEEMGDK